MAEALLDTALERELLLASGLFDEQEYLSQAGPEAVRDPAGHYLETGWRFGLDPRFSFPGSLLRPYFSSIGKEEPPAITWIMLRSGGWDIPATWEEILHLSALVRQTGLFDDAFYSKQMGSAGEFLNPAIHYVTVGERAGMQPSPAFDSAYYGERYQDVVRAGCNLLLHYFHDGRREGRQPLPVRSWRKGQRTEDPDKDNVILVVHDTSRTGAPILGWNIARHLMATHNIYVMQMGAGDLTPQFEALSVELCGPFEGRFRPFIAQEDVEYSFQMMVDSRPFSYAIVNSAESMLAIEPLANRFIPTLLLMHEFASYVFPPESVRNAFSWCSEVIFPARLVERAAEEVHPVLSGRVTRVLPQGVSLLPPVESGVSDTGQAPNPVLSELIRKKNVDGTFIVLGAGHVQIRKGIDLFLSAAAAIAKKQPDASIHFVWVGEGFNPRLDMGYSVYLKEQLNRSDLLSRVTFLDAVSDLDPVYDLADIFFLSSRLDPLPNVGIDAAIRGIPVVCFRDASGMAELMLRDSLTAECVVDYLDAEAAAQMILNLAEDSGRRRRIQEATRNLAAACFNMEGYVAKLNEIGMEAAARMKLRSADAATLRQDPTFDQDMFLGLSKLLEPRATTIARYLAISSAGYWKAGIPRNDAYRRPAPGFNPFIYAQTNLLRLSEGVDPLADFIRQGKPTGPWLLPVLRPRHADKRTPPSSDLRAALHAHFYYPDLAGEFLARLKPSQTGCDLLVSTNTEEKAQQLTRALAAYDRGSLDIRVFPNRGRDIGPLLTGFATKLSEYDVIGHVHAKRSPDIGDGSLGDTWREFLWQSLLGGMYPMLDEIVGAFERDKHLGLIFPGDPHMNAWDSNRELAATLAARMGWHGPLPNYFDFPLGNMYWARREVLEPLLGLGIAFEDYPEEPVAYDGTLLHALERLPPFACSLAGFKSAVTHIAGVTW